MGNARDGGGNDEVTYELGPDTELGQAWAASPNLEIQKIVQRGFCLKGYDDLFQSASSATTTTTTTTVVTATEQGATEQEANFGEGAFVRDVQGRDIYIEDDTGKRRKVTLSTDAAMDGVVPYSDVKDDYKGFIDLYTQEHTYTINTILASKLGDHGIIPSASADLELVLKKDDKGVIHFSVIQPVTSLRIPDPEHSGMMKSIDCAFPITLHGHLEDGKLVIDSLGMPSIESSEELTLDDKKMAMMLEHVMEGGVECDQFVSKPESTKLGKGKKRAFTPAEKARDALGKLKEELNANRPEISNDSKDKHKLSKKELTTYAAWQLALVLSQRIAMLESSPAEKGSKRTKELEHITQLANAVANYLKNPNEQNLKRYTGLLAKFEKINWAQGTLGAGAATTGVTVMAAALVVAGTALGVISAPVTIPGVVIGGSVTALMASLAAAGAGISVTGLGVYEMLTATQNKLAKEFDKNRKGRVWLENVGGGAPSSPAATTTTTTTTTNVDDAERSVESTEVGDFDLMQNDSQPSSPAPSASGMFGGGAAAGSSDAPDPDDPGGKAKLGGSAPKKGGPSGQV